MKMQFITTGVLSKPKPLKSHPWPVGSKVKTTKAISNLTDILWQNSMYRLWNTEGVIEGIFRNKSVGFYYKITHYQQEGRGTFAFYAEKELELIS